MNVDHERLKEILAEATAKTSPTERALYLDEACRSDAALRARVEAMLAAHDRAGDFLEAPVIAVPQQTEVGSVPLTQKPGDRIGHYKLLEQIGEGGCGVVYVAEQEAPVRRRVALKVIKLGMDTKAVIARFEAERQALALMDHPNIAKVFDAGATETGRPFFVMELVRGVKITDYCDQHNVPMPERLDLFVEVCHAIQHAHQKGIIHRDIKPSNILVMMADDKPVPKVIDFGIAKATAHQTLTDKTLYTAFEQFIGTPAYMSPEQAGMSGLDIDTRSDIYSLGVLLYELLTGSTPFDTRELLESGLDHMRQIIREREPVRPSTRLTQLESSTQSKIANRKSKIENDLDWIVMKCLQKDRTRRYETANGLAGDIEHHLSHEPVVARPPSTAYRVQKFVRRNKVMVTAAAAVALALVLGIVASTWLAFRERQQRDRAEANEQIALQAQAEEARQRKAAQQAQRQAEAEKLLARRQAYVADMNLAYQAFYENNLGRASELLDRHRPSPQEQDFRGWEWRYLWSLCQSDALYTLGRHSDRVFGVAISPDGKLLATVSVQGEAKIWDLASRTVLAIPEANDARMSVAFSPDGTTLAFGMRHGVKLWDVQQLREIAQFPGEHGGPFGRPALGFSADGRQLAIGEANGSVVFWDLGTRTAGMTLREHSIEISSLVFSPDGQTLATGSWDGTVRIWSLKNGQELARLTNHTDRVQCVAYSPDGRTLASGSWDASIRIWDLAQRRQVAVLTNHTRWIAALAFSPDGSTLASASADYLIKFWDSRDWRELRTLRGSQDEVYGLAFSRDGNTLFSGTKGGEILVWDGKPQPLPARVVRRPVDAAAFWLQPPGPFPIAWYSNNTFNLWDPVTFRKLPEHRAPLIDFDQNSLLSPSGNTLALASHQGFICLWDIEREIEITRLPVALPPGYWMQFSPDGELLAAISEKGLMLWNLETGEEIATMPKSASWPCGFSFMTNNLAFAVGNADGTVEVWDLVEKKRVANWKAHKTPTAVAFMPDGHHLVMASQDSTAALWALDPVREVRRFGRTLNAFFSVCVSLDGQRVAAGTSHGQIKIWDSATGQELATLRGINDWSNPARPAASDFVRSLVFLPPDGNVLISGTDYETRLWRAPSWTEIEEAEKRAEVKRE